MAEWLKALVLKTSSIVRCSWVQIPPQSPLLGCSRCGFRSGGIGRRVGLRSRFLGVRVQLSWPLKKFTSNVNFLYGFYFFNCFNLFLVELSGLKRGAAFCLFYLVKSL